jgi:hypothetical protein
MSRELSHEEAFVALDAAALDALEPAERDAILAHAAGCDECRAELASLRVTAGQLAFAAPAAVMEESSRARIHSRLMARAAADAGAGTATMRATEERATRTRIINMLAWRRAEWVAVAASILMVVSIGMLAMILREREDLRVALKAQTAQVARAQSASDSLRVAMMSRDSVIAGLTGKNVAMMTLTASGVNAPFARMFWDQANNAWTLVAHNMPALKPGRTYQLWLVTASAKISAGTFDPRNGDAIVRATYALSPADLKALAITEEPAGGMPQPTGTPVLAITAH